MKIEKLLKIIKVISLTAFSVCLEANNEKYELHNVVTELHTVKKIIKQAESSANKDARIRFDYEVLQKDLEKIRQGIQDYINAVQRDPRQLPEINGEYKH